MSLTERNIQVEFVLEPPEWCPLKDVEIDVDKVLVARDADTCRCDIMVNVRIDDEVGTLVGQVSSQGFARCAGHIFNDYGCVPEIVDVANSQIAVRTFIDDETDLDGLIKELGEVCENVKLRRLTSNKDRRLAENVKDVDLTDFTEKQREAMEYAISEGYYARPREISLAEMAAEFGISEQALAQRLARAEEKVMKQLFT